MAKENTIDEQQPWQKTHALVLQECTKWAEKIDLVKRAIEAYFYTFEVNEQIIREDIISELERTEQSIARANDLMVYDALLFVDCFNPDYANVQAALARWHYGCMEALKFLRADPDNLAEVLETLTSNAFDVSCYQKDIATPMEA